MIRDTLNLKVESLTRLMISRELADIDGSYFRDYGYLRENVILNTRSLRGGC